MAPGEDKEPVDRPVTGSSLPDVLFITAANSLITLGGILSGVFVARMLGPEGRGEWAAIVLWPGIIAYISALGADVVIGRQVARDNGKVTHYIFVATALALTLGGMFVIVAITVLPHLISGGKHHLTELS